MKKRGLEPYMITGDNSIVANAIAKERGITKVFSEVLPHEKANIISDIQKEGIVTVEIDFACWAGVTEQTQIKIFKAEQTQPFDRLRHIQSKTNIKTCPTLNLRPMSNYKKCPTLNLRSMINYG